MAKIKLSTGGFTLIPEGVTIFKVTAVEHDEDFGKVEITLQTKDGQKQFEKITYINDKGEINEGALNRFSYFAKNCMNNFNIDEIDPEDLVGCYIKATVRHEKYIRTKDKNKGKEMTSVKLNDFAVALGFDGVAAKGNPEPIADDDEMDFLNDL